MNREKYTATYTRWRKATRSGEEANCVEVAPGTDTTEYGTTEHSVGVRDSKNRRGPYLEFTGPEWALFLAAAKSGTYDQAR